MLYRAVCLQAILSIIAVKETLRNVASLVAGVCTYVTRGFWWPPLALMGFSLALVLLVL